MPTTTSDPNDPCDPDPNAVPTADCDDDGNPNSSDPNPTAPTVADDAFTAAPGQVTSFDILVNDDFLPGANTSITDTGNGTATGTIAFDNLTGEIDYTPAPGEEGTVVTVEYTVCNTPTSV